MPKRLETLLEAIGSGAAPRVILVGGTSEFLAEQAWRTLRDAIVAQNPSIAVETYEAGSDLSAVLDSFRTLSLFGGNRLLLLPDVNAFVSAKEITSLFEKALTEWRSAKTDRKRSTAAGKLLHALGLVSADLEMSDRAIATALGVSLDGTLTDLLAFCRASGKKPGRGEDDAALLGEAVTRGGAPGAILLMRTGEIPKESATIDLIDRNGAVVVTDLSRETFSAALTEEITQRAAEAEVRFEAPAISRLRQRLGIERMLADKFSKDVPDLRAALNEADRLITLAGAGGRVTPDLVEREIAAIEGGARYEIGSLFTEGKILEAVVKLRELVAQGRREDPKMPVDMQYGRFLFPLADEVRQMIGIHSWARTQNVDLRTPLNYNRFKDTIADRLGDYLKQHGLVRQRPHPFPLHKKWEAARATRESDLFRALSELSQIEIARKSGGLPADIALETFLLQRIREAR